MRLSLCWIVVAFFFSKAAAQSNIPPSSEILWQIKSLNNTASVLYVAAHPDDENTRFIAYLSKIKQIRTGYLSLTRGDGGQNLIGIEKGPLLGMLRTQELMMARLVDGGQQFFTRAYDFGYSKTPEETFRFWDKQKVLSDVVYCIRQFQPDIIVCRFPSTGEGGHGHHTASAILAQEAFSMAANAHVFPEQLKTVKVWQAKSLYWNTFNFGGNNTTSDDQLKIDVGSFHPLLGAFAGEVAADSRSMHKSQGFGASARRGSGLEYFKFIKGEPAKNDLFEHIPTNWTRFPETKDWDKDVDAVVSSFNAENPAASLDPLIQVYKKWNSRPLKSDAAEAMRVRKLELLNNIIRQCAGIYVASTTNNKSIIRNDKIEVLHQLTNGGAETISWNGVHIHQKDTTFQSLQKPNEALSFSQLISTENLISTSPYWLSKMPEAGLYQHIAPQQVNQPINDVPLKATYQYSIRGVNFSYTVPVLYTETDPVKGELKQQLNILPKVTLQWSESPLLINHSTTKATQLQVHNYGDSATYTLAIEKNSHSGLDIDFPKTVFLPAHAKVEIPIKITAGKKMAKSVVPFYLQQGKEKYHQSVSFITYDHIPTQALIQDAPLIIQPVNITVPEEKFAYLPGAGDEVRESLRNIGVQIDLLDPHKLTTEDLQQYKAIITGVRAYNIDNQLSTYHSKLMDYVHQGGNLIVQYNTNSRAGPLNKQIGPLPFEITRNRVTDETAPVEILQPRHIIFEQPNKITAKDFEGWVQERGIYFGKDTASHYMDLLAMKDPGEALQNGSLMWLSHGKGNFFYTGLVFFRQLPAGVEGAYKLLLNMMAIPENYKIQP